MSHEEDESRIDVEEPFETLFVEDVKMAYQKPRSSIPGARYHCPYGCNKMVSLRTVDYHKNNGCSRVASQAFAESKKRCLSCGVCYSEFVTRMEFFEHLKIEHDVHPEIHQLAFKDRHTFNRFIHWMESEGGAHYRQKSGSKRRCRGKGIFLCCNRSGFVGEGKTEDSKSRTGPFRLGYTCTAFVHGTEHADGHVTAEFCGDHYGHDSRMRIPNVIKSIIAQKQLEGDSNEDILNYLRNHFGPLVDENIYAQRICYIDNEELKNIFTWNTKKWESGGIPTTCEIWEEELLDRAGISREGIPRLRDYNEKTTAEIAIDENWPRPKVFIAKIRTPEGTLIPMTTTGEHLNNDYLNIRESRYQQEPYPQEEFEDNIDLEEEAPEGESYPKRIRLTSISNPESEVVIDETGELRTDLDVQAETEVETSYKDHGEDEPSSSKQIYSTPNLSNHPFCEMYLALYDELSSLKSTLDSDRRISEANLRTALVRLKSIHANLIGEKTKTNVTYSTNNRDYRPGRDVMTTPWAKYAARGEISLCSVAADEMSDDEEFVDKSTMNFNAAFWM